MKKGTYHVISKLYTYKEMYCMIYAEMSGVNLVEMPAYKTTMHHSNFVAKCFHYCLLNVILNYEYTIFICNTETWKLDCFASVCTITYYKVKVSRHVAFLPYKLGLMISGSVLVFGTLGKLHAAYTINVAPASSRKNIVLLIIWGNKNFCLLH